mmetsp:Transcript_17186/g.27873  ORF Transcript_17186/g.27873 Transcript_17186/m.27873 type:complete len:126 (+) Transcript_17186:357-734(+)
MLLTMIPDPSFPRFETEDCQTFLDYFKESVRWNLLKTNSQCIDWLNKSLSSNRISLWREEEFQTLSSLMSGDKTCFDKLWSCIAKCLPPKIAAVEDKNLLIRNPLFPVLVVRGYTVQRLTNIVFF